MKIGEIAQRTGIAESTLRYYEKKGLIRVVRDDAGHRDYPETDIDWIAFIKRLKDTGMLLKDIRRYSDLRYQGDATVSERFDMLEQHRCFVMEECQKWALHLRNLDDKIGIYKEMMANSTKNNVPVIRHIQKGDSRLEVSGVYEQSWKTAYQGMVPQSYLDNIPKGHWEDFLNSEGVYILVLLEENRIIGTCAYSEARDPDMQGWGEIISLYLLPEYTGKGLGVHLLDYAVHQLTNLGLENIYLWVLEENIRARSFYKKLGFVQTDKAIKDCIGGKPLGEIQYIKKNQRS